MKIRKLFFTLTLSLFFAAGIFAQNDSSEDSLDLPQDLLDELNSKDTVDPSLQRNFTIVMAEQNFDLNPHTAAYSNEAQVLDALYEGLFSYNPKTLEPTPAIASGYTISRNKKRWTFTIRPEAKFSDGSAITAQDVKDSWLALLKTKNAPYASLLDCISGAEEYRNGKGKADAVGITARNTNTLVVVLNSPMAHFSKLLCHHAFSVQKKKAYSGAFVLKNRDSKSLVLEKNENYWDASHVSLPQITIEMSNNLKDNSWKFNDEKVDWVASMIDVKSLLNKNSLRISAIFGTEYLFFSCKKAPWTNADLRNALLTAVPWKELRKGLIQPATTLVFPLAGYPKVEGLSETSPEDALDMMNAARKALKLKDKEKLTLTFGIIKDSERQKAQYELLKKAWEPLGVELKMVTADDSRYVQKLPKWDCDLFSYSWIGDFADPVAFLELFRTDSTLNPSNWKNDNFTSFLEQASQTNDSAERYKLLSKAEQVLLDDGEILPIGHSFCMHAVNPDKIGGWSLNALDIHPFKYLYIREKFQKVKRAPNVVMQNQSQCTNVRLDS